MSVADAFLEQLAQRVADLVVDRLQSQRLQGFYDQDTSPLGPRHHCSAIRSGKLRGHKVGRKFIATIEDVAAYLRSLDPHAEALIETRVGKRTEPQRDEELGLVVGAKRR
jgi:hypothetical protein